MPRTATIREPDLSRRSLLQSVAALLGLGSAAHSPAADAPSALRLTTFSADVTPPLGHPCMAGGIAPVRQVDDPLLARGLVLLGAGRPIVFVAVDWCEIRNGAYERWRSALAEAVETDPTRVLVSSVHQHDAPVADLEAERLLEANDCAGRICDLAFHEQAVERAATAARKALTSARPVSHLGLGQAKVERVASNRRHLDPSGKVAFGRTSTTREAWARQQPEGTIDPWLKTLSFWNGDQALVAISVYATHPMSRYGQGRVSSDFVGLARQRRQHEEKGVFQIYASGCSGNVTAGKYNDGSPGTRPALAERIREAMAAAWRTTRRVPLDHVSFRSVPLRLQARGGPGFTKADLTRQLESDANAFRQCLAALGLSWRQRVEAGRPIDLSLIDFGPAQLLLLPAESYVEYQLLAQAERPDSFVTTVGYGECGPGYIPTEKAVEEGDTNLRDWCWVAPGAEQAMTEAIRKVIRG